MVAEYVEHALQFERLAAHEKNPQLKADLEKQAAAYRRLAADEQKRWGCSPRSSTEELHGHVYRNSIPARQDRRHYGR